MENRVVNSHGAEIPKKSRSLDLKSLYESGVSKEFFKNKSLKRKESSQEGVDENRSININNKRKKSRKALPLSSFRTNHDSSSSKSLTEVYDGGVCSGQHGPESLKKLGLSQKSKNGCSANGISLRLGDSGTSIPRRKRGFVGRNKFESGQVLKSDGRPCTVVVGVSEDVKLASEDSSTQNVSLKVEEDKLIDDFKENRSSEPSLVQHLKEEDSVAGYLAVNDGDSSFKRPRRKPRKRKDTVKGGKCFSKKAERLVDSSVKPFGDLQDDDEENLEENAARMLSSRFDPSCTGFSLNSKASLSPSDNGLSFLLAGRDTSSRSKNFSGCESPTVDASGRVLRPRKRHGEKGNSRKRRHFYEIFSGDLDANWVLNRKIKVFWPLDKSWYYGLVNDYDKERKLHHVKYDDRDEEWVNLQKERFKLLLFPSEVPNKSQPERFQGDGGTGDRIRNMKLNKENGKRNAMTEDDSGNGSYMESEPIISWLARSSRRVKSLPLHAVKRQKTSASLSFERQPLSCDGAVDENGCLHGDSLKARKVKLFGSSALSDRPVDGRRIEDSSLVSTSCPKDSKHPIVYFRRRFRRTEKVLWQASESICGDSRVSKPITFLGSVDDFQDLGELDVCLGRLDPEGDLLFTDNAGQLQLNILLLHSKQFRFGLNFPMLSANLFGAKSFLLVHSLLLLQCGTVMTIWPIVHLEVLFVDNEVGLRFLLFQGSLKEAVAFIFQVLKVFYRPAEQEKFADVQVPITSIRFKCSLTRDFRKRIVFACCYFHEVKHFKWMFLDCKLKRYCVLNRQLPLSECTYDNIKALQNGTNQLFGSAYKGSSSLEGSRRRYRQGLSRMGVSRGSSCLEVGQLSSSSDKQRKNLPLFTLSFGAAPTFFFSLHLKLLMDYCVARISFQDHDSIENPESSGNLLVDESSNREDCVKKSFESSLGNFLKASSKVASVTELMTLDLSVSSDGCWRKSLQKLANSDQIVNGSPSIYHNPEEVGASAICQLEKQKCDHSESQQPFLSSEVPVDGDKKGTGSSSDLNGIRVELPPFDQYKNHVDSKLPSTHQSTDLTWNMNGSVFPTPNPTAPRSYWHRNRSSSSIGYHARRWSDGKADFFHDNFGNGPKKPRTQVSYSMPFGGLDYSSKNIGDHQRGLPHKRIRRANEKRSSDVSRGSQRNMELVSCHANLLLTLGDRGWRECGAQVALELFDRNEWKLAVKMSGSTRCSYKAHQFLQPGSTNRYTHAMMWKGGKDWILEFTDRSQWALFKDMHEECYNRNIRAASVKNIPIPGVRLVHDYDENATDVTFVRSSFKYLRQVETDVEMALDPSHVFYDMDTDDEQWISGIHRSSQSDGSCSSLEFSDEMFEKIMDMFEKAACTQQCDQFNSDEIEELMAGVGSMEVIRAVYEHWQEKRQRVGMPLIRHLQPPLWERYEQQVREWELTMAKVSPIPSNAIEKPPMFAFCLKPRGLEVPNKGSKQRSQRKISVSGQINPALGDHEGCHSFGRRSNGFLFGDEKVLYPNYESLEDSPLSQASPRVFSQLDSGIKGYFRDGFGKHHHQKLRRSEPKKICSFLLPNKSQMTTSYSQRLFYKRNGIHQQSMAFSEWPSVHHYFSDGLQRHGSEQLDNPDIDVFRYRDAASAARHALKMAKFKRERAQRLLFKADLAIHKAVVALTTAEAIKASSDNLNGDG